MKKVEAFLEKLYDRKLTEEYDAIIPVVGDEGNGKSTFMLEATILWKRTTDQEVDAEEILDQLVWGEREEFREALADSPPRCSIPVMDAAHALFKREAAQPEQIETEKSLLDIRMKELLIMLGYQEFDDMPTILQERRAKYAFFIPQRGVVHGYNRDSLDEWYQEDERPDPDLTDTFPSLEGSDLWKKYKRRDRQRKEERILGYGDDEEEQDDGPNDFSLAEEVKNGGLEKVVGWHGGHSKPYIKSDLIQAHYGFSINEANRVKALLEQDPSVDPAEHYEGEEQDGAE